MSESQALALNQERDITLANLWSQWRCDGSAEARNQLYIEYAPMARKVAAIVLKRFRHPLADWNDYVHFATIGLLQAIEQFDPERGTSFPFYAVHRIRGAILNGLKSYTSESVLHREELERIKQYANELSIEGDDPFDTILNAIIGMAFGYFLEYGVLDFDHRDERPDNIYEQYSQQKLLFQYVDQLPERERFVIKSRYFQQLEFIEIAKLLDLSAPRVNQLHAQALQRMRVWYERDHDG